MPLTASSIYGTFAANPVTDAHGVVYLQDLRRTSSRSTRTAGTACGRAPTTRRTSGPMASSCRTASSTERPLRSRSRSTPRPGASCGGTPGWSRPPARRGAASWRAASASTSSRRSRRARLPVDRRAAGRRHRLRARRQDRADDLVLRHGHRPGRRQDHRGRRLEPARDRPRRDRLPRDREHVPAGDRGPEDAGPAAVRRQHASRSTARPASSSGSSRRSRTTSTTGICSSRRSTRRAAAATSCSRPGRWATSTRMDPGTGKLIWKTKVGVHNGHDHDGAARDAPRS